MANASILLARHGEHDEVGRVLSGRSDIGLNDVGEAQATALAAWLAEEEIAAIHASPRRRTLQTAAPVGAARGLQVQSTPALDEIDFGTFTGRAFADLDGDPDWQRWNAERATAACPGGETMAAMLRRVTAHVMALPPEPVLLVTHCDVIRGLIAHALGMELGAMFRLACEPGSISRLSRDGDMLTLLSLNERPRHSSSPRSAPIPGSG